MFALLYEEIVEYTTEILEERYFSIFHIARKFRISYDIAQSYIDKMLENGVISESKHVGIGVSYKVES
ncbi:DNA translocase FtsK [Listeria monocytogenes]